ncbi:MAG: D-alanyl-D-alanine carboxypeptidase family protein, partial [Christensenellales bacterium]
YAMQNEFFRELVKTEYKTLPWEGHEWDRVVKNKNKILWNYEGGNGIKTGYTDDAGKCLCASAQRDEMQLISVVLSAPDMFKDCMSLMDFGFNNYSNRLIIESDEHIGEITVRDGMKDGFSVYTQQNVYYPLKDDEYVKLEKRVYIDKMINAPVSFGQQVGYIDIWLGENKIYSVNLTAPKSIGENSYQFNLGRIFEFWIK